MYTFPLLCLFVLCSMCTAALPPAFPGFCTAWGSAAPLSALGRAAGAELGRP